MLKSLSISAAAAALVSGAAVADYDLEFDVDGPGGNGSSYAVELEGSLAGMNVDANFVNLGGFTWAGDLLITIIDPEGNGLQFGGYDIDEGLPNAGDFPSSWDSSASGTYVHSVSLESLGLSGSGVWSISVIDGYTNGADTDRWDGTITLEGVSLVPAPGAIALLGIAGIAGRRRRRK